MEKLFLDDFINYKYLSSLEFSPNSNFTAFIKSQIDISENKYNSSIELLDNTYKTTENLIDLEENTNFIWKDEQTIIFTDHSPKDKSKRKKKEAFTSIYEIDIYQKKPVKLFELNLNIKSMKLINNETLAFTAEFDPKFSNFIDLNQEEKDQFLLDLKGDSDFQVLDEIPFWGNGQGFTNKIRNALYIYNIEEDRKKKKKEDFTDVYDFRLSRDKNNIVLISNSYIDKKYSYTDLQTYDIENDRLLKISPYDNFNYSYANFLEGKIIFIGTDMKDFGLNQNPVFYITSQDGNITEKISKDSFNFSIINSIGSDCRYGEYSTIKVDGNFLYFVTTEGDSSFLNRIDKEGNIEKLTYRKGSIDSITVKNGYLEFIGLRSLRLQEIYLLNNRNELQITNYNQWIMNEKTLSIPEKLTFKTEDETLIEGWVMKPIDFQLGRKYPAILNIHGGPKTAFGEVFFHEMQYLANEGYIVFFCNPRGSDGRGDKFADIRGKYGTNDYKDIMDFTDLVLEKYHFIDKDRIGIMGGSYGGFMTNWIIGHTDRFKAAVSQRSISNWISKFGTTDIGYYFVDDQMSATPWNDFNKLWDSSPLKYADKVTTPTLFIHSEEDYRCSISEAFQMFTALKYHGVETKLCLFKEENHELSRSGKPKNRIKRLEEIRDWFEKYLW